MQTQMSEIGSQTPATIKPRLSRRVIVPSTAEITPEAADRLDARKVRFGFSPSYHLNLGELTGNRYVGYMNIYPRRLYRFDWVYPVGINESLERMDEEKPKLPAFAKTSRSPRTCAEDVVSVADTRVFRVLDALTDRDDAQDIWDAIYPVEVEAEVFAVTHPDIRGEVPEYLPQYYWETGLNFPYVKEGHALAMFIKHLDEQAAGLIDAAGFDAKTREIAKTALREMRQAAGEAHRYRYNRLNISFGSKESRESTGVGKPYLDEHDHQCMAETGIDRPEDKPVVASQKMGEEIGNAIADRQAESESQLASAVTALAENQRLTMEQAAEDRKLILALIQQNAQK